MHRHAHIYIYGIYIYINTWHIYIYIWHIHIYIYIHGIYIYIQIYIPLCIKSSRLVTSFVGYNFWALGSPPYKIRAPNPPTYPKLLPAKVDLVMTSFFKNPKISPLEELTSISEVTCQNLNFKNRICLACTPFFVEPDFHLGAQFLYSSAFSLRMF